MSLITDTKKARKVAEILYKEFNSKGIHGRKDMPEDLQPKRTSKGSLEHILFITLTVSIDYQRDAVSLWANSRKTFEDASTRYLFSPQDLYKTEFSKIVKDMQKHKLSKKVEKDARIWKTIGVAFYKKWNSNPLNFLKDCKWDSLVILDRLKKSFHIENNKYVPDYPYLKGNKIGPLWVRMLRDNLGIDKLTNLKKIPIPVDIHIARATLALGIVKGRFEANFIDFFEEIRKIWSQAIEGLNIKGREMIALDVDEPLWHLSKYGCTKRNKLTGACPLHGKCQLRDFCIKGKIVMSKSKIDLDTI